MEQQMQQDAWGSVRIACVAQCFCENCLQMIKKEQKPPNNSPDLKYDGDVVSGSDTCYFEIFIRSLKQFLNKKSHQEKIWDNFLQPS